MMGFLNGFCMMLIAIFMAAPTAMAGNVHEHIQYLPTYEDIQHAVGGSLGKFRMSDLIQIDPKKHYLQNLESQFGKNLFSEKQWQKMIENETLESFCEKIAATPRMRKIRLSEIFELTPKRIMRGLFMNEDWHVNPKGAYQSAGSIRNRLFFHLDQNHSILTKSIEKNLKNSRIWQNSKSVLSVPKKLANPNVLNSITQIFQKHGYQSQYYLSIPRGILEDQAEKEFKKTLQLIQNGAQEGWLHGVDVSGSIRERWARNQKSESIRFKDRLKQIFEHSHHQEIALRIHAFEESNRGPFYDDFWEVLKNSAEQKKLPHTLRIGHIQGLLKEDIHRIGQYRNAMDIIFEANPESNLALNRSYTETLVNNIQMIHQSGMKVALGSDGAGILGTRSNYSMSLSRLMDAGMSEASMNKLIQEGKNPLPGLKWDPAFQRKLNSETDELVASLKKTTRPSKIGCMNWYNRNLKELFIPLP
jgi:hypothetical protein